MFGFLILLVFFGTPIALFFWFERKYGNGIRQRQRDRQIETAMRLGLRDAEAQERIARKIRDEQW